MSIIRSIPISLVALAIVLPSARAQQDQTSVTLVQTVEPITRSYPGVSADILGIQTGMTVAQAEAIAAKNYSSKPQEQKSALRFQYKDISVLSQPFVNTVILGYGSEDILTLLFSSPASGNTLYSMSRTIAFNSDPVKQPLVSTIATSLIKKYGPPSRQTQTGGGDLLLKWVFGQHSLVLKPTDGGQFNANDAALVENNIASQEGAIEEARQALQAGEYFVISVDISHRGQDSSKASQMIIGIEDFQAVIQAGEAAKLAMNDAAVKFYAGEASKTSAGPKL